MLIICNYYCSLNSVNNVFHNVKYGFLCKFYSDTHGFLNKLKLKLHIFMDFTRTEFKLILNMNLLLISEHLNLFEKCICLFF